MPFMTLLFCHQPTFGILFGGKYELEYAFWLNPLKCGYFINTKLNKKFGSAVKKYYFGL